QALLVTSPGRPYRPQCLLGIAFHAPRDRNQGRFDEEQVNFDSVLPADRAQFLEPALERRIRRSLERKHFASYEFAEVSAEALVGQLIDAQAGETTSIFLGERIQLRAEDHVGIVQTAAPLAEVGDFPDVERS